MITFEIISLLKTYFGRKHTQSIALVFCGAPISISWNLPFFDLGTGRGRVLWLESQYEQVCGRGMWEQTTAAEGKEACREGRGSDAPQAGRGQLVEGTQWLLCLLFLLLSLVKWKVHNVLVVYIFLLFLELAIFHYQWVIYTYAIQIHLRKSSFKPLLCSRQRAQQFTCKIMLIFMNILQKHH